MTNQPFSPNMIAVIVGLDLIGDALIKLPFLHALAAAFPGARINWITSQGGTAYSGPLRAATQSLIYQILQQPDFLPTRKMPKADVSKAPPFDLVIDTRNRWREALYARRLPHKIFIAPAWRFLLSDRRPSWFAPKQPHLLDRLLQLVELASGHKPDGHGRLTLDPALVAKARALLPADKVTVGLAPGAGNRVKIWPLENYIALAQQQTAAGRVPVFILGPDEIGWREKIAGAVPGALFPLQDRIHWGTGKITLDETLALGSLLTLAVANDSGTSHMLAAAGCPLVSLFGPTDPAKLAPRTAHARILKAQDFGALDSMAEIPVAAVAAAVEALLKQRG